MHVDRQIAAATRQRSIGLNDQADFNSWLRKTHPCRVGFVRRRGLGNLYLGKHGQFAGSGGTNGTSVSIAMLHLKTDGIKRAIRRTGHRVVAGECEAVKMPIHTSYEHIGDGQLAPSASTEASWSAELTPRLAEVLQVLNDMLDVGPDLEEFDAACSAA